MCYGGKNFILNVCSDTEEGAPEVGGAEGVAEEGTPAAEAAVGGGEEAGDEDDSPFKDSDEEDTSPPTKKQKLLDEGTSGS